LRIEAERKKIEKMEMKKDDEKEKWREVISNRIA
jgi:hypothetical protein